MSERRAHPSGRPIRPSIVKDPRPLRRLPPAEPLTPGLRRPDSRVEAIGFHAALTADEGSFDEH
jgi:hypothetical protein